MTKDHPEGLISPGNEEYLSYYKEQKEWISTKSVGKIAAMSAGPGPAIVSLPPLIGDDGHDPRKPKAPSYTVGDKDFRTCFIPSPGPAAYDTRKLTNKGKDECHAPLVGHKPECSPIPKSPGPAKYDRGVCDPAVYPRSPAYTLRIKPPKKKLAITPAPDRYSLPDCLGPGRSPFAGSPAYTMSERWGDMSKYGTQNPGPAAYVLPSPNVNRRKMPAFTMGARDKCIRTGTTSPGPASSLYDKVKFNKPSTPRYTFGIRHSPFKAFQGFAAEQ